MTLYLEGVLRQQFEDAKKAYEAAIEKPDLALAREKAATCGRILRKLATDYPNRYHLKDAEQWDKIATGIKEGRIRGGPKGKAEAGAQTEEAVEGQFDAYIESLISTSQVTWADIGGLEKAKRLLMENVVIAVIQNKPDAIKPWHGVLLFGPPGTGKTLLAAAAAGSLKATFFQAPADKVLSKYYGESSKLIAALYEVAWEKAEAAPSIVFIDEFDSLAVSRGGQDVSEASRRTLSTLLSEIEGFKNKKSDRLVLTLATTNTPWALDEAMLTRFPLRIYVSLPDTKAIADIIKIQTKGVDISQLDLNALAEKCRQKYFSGREIGSLCRQALWHMVREENPNFFELSYLDLDEIKKRSLKSRSLKESDFADAFSQIKTVVTGESLKRYEDWAAQFGSN